MIHLPSAYIYSLIFHITMNILNYHKIERSKFLHFIPFYIIKYNDKTTFPYDDTRKSCSTSYRLSLSVNGPSEKLICHNLINYGLN